MIDLPLFWVRRVVGQQVRRSLVHHLFPNRQLAVRRPSRSREHRPFPPGSVGEIDYEAIARVSMAELMLLLHQQRLNSVVFLQEECRSYAE